MRALAAAHSLSNHLDTARIYGDDHQGGLYGGAQPVRGREGRDAEEIREAFVGDDK